MNEELIENFNVDLRRLDDNELVKAIEENASNDVIKGKVFRFIPALEELQDDLKGEIDFDRTIDRIIASNIPLNFRKEIYVPSDLSKLNAIARKIIIQKSLKSEKEIERVLYDDNVLFDAIISNGLYAIDTEDSIPNDIFVLSYKQNIQTLKELAMNFIDDDDYPVEAEELVEYFVEHFNVDLSQLDDNELIAAIEENADEDNIANGQVVPFMEQADDIGEEFGYEFEGGAYEELHETTSLDYERQLHKPTNLSRVNAIAKNIIRERVLNTEDEVQRVLYDENALLDAIISEGLYSVFTYYDNDTSEIFSITYHADTTQVRNELYNYIFNSFYYNDEYEHNYDDIDKIARRMEVYISSIAEDINSDIIKENPDGVIDDIVIEEAVTQGIDENVARQLDIHNDVTIELGNLFANIDFEEFAKHEQDYLKEHKISLTDYVENELLDRLQSQGVIDSNRDIVVKNVEFDEDTIQEIKDEYDDIEDDEGLGYSDIYELAVKIDKYFKAHAHEFVDFLIKENPDGIINNIVVDVATNDGIPYEVAKQLDVTKDVDIRFNNVRLDANLEDIAENEDSFVRSVGNVDTYLENELFVRMFYKDYMNFDVETVNINEDAIREIESEM